MLIERKSFVPGLRARTITGSTHSHVQLPVLLNWELFWPNRLCVSRTNRLVRKTLHNNDLNQVADQQFSLKQWFAVGAHSCRHRKTGSAHCYLKIFPSAHEQFSHFARTDALDFVDRPIWPLSSDIRGHIRELKQGRRRRQRQPRHLKIMIWLVEWGKINVQRKLWFNYLTQAAKWQREISKFKKK